MVLVLVCMLVLALLPVPSATTPLNYRPGSLCMTLYFFLTCRVHPSPPERCPQGSGAVLLKIEQSQLRLSALHS